MTKEELNRYYYYKKEIKQLEEKIEEINSTYIKGSKISDEVFQRKMSNPQEKRMILIEKYQSKLEQAKINALEEVIKIEEYINSIEDPETRMIFRYRYIDFKKWNEISRLVNLSRSIVFERHQKQIG